MTSLKVILILKLLILDIFALDQIQQQQITTEDMVATLQMQMFNDFKVTYHKHYGKPEAEVNAKNCFINNVALVNEHNMKFDKGETTFRLGISELSDMSIEDLKERLNGFQPIKFSRRPKTTEAPQDTTEELLTCEHTNQIVETNPDVNERVINDPLKKPQDQTLQLIPDSTDWRFSLQPIRFQDYSCSSCWVFTTVALIESHYFIRFNKSISLSEQYLLDCVPFICNDGHFYDGLEFIMNNGIPLSADYNGTERCPKQIQKAPLNVLNYTILDTFDEEEVKRIVGTIGPVAMGIDGSLQNFIFYKSGIFSQSICTQNKNHAVLIVGYGTENGLDFWWIRNSWGKTWGINGYAKIIRNNQKNCGMAELAMYPNAITM